MVPELVVVPDFFFIIDLKSNWAYCIGDTNQLNSPPLLNPSPSPMDGSCKHQRTTQLNTKLRQRVLVTALSIPQLLLFVSFGAWIWRIRFFADVSRSICWFSQHCRYSCFENALRIWVPVVGRDSYFEHSLPAWHCVTGWTGRSSIIAVCIFGSTGAAADSASIAGILALRMHC